MKPKKISRLQKFSLLMWKNWLLQKRKVKQTFLEIFFSVIFCILLVVIRDLAPSDIHREPTVFEPFDISSLPNSLEPSSGENIFSSVINYFFEDEEVSRKKRDVHISEKDFCSNSTSWIDIEKAKSSDKFEQFLRKNPQREDLVNKLLEMTGLWMCRKWRLHKNKVHGQKRRKRFTSLFDDWWKDPAWPIAYAPNNTVVTEIMEKVGNYLYLDTKGYGFATESEMVDHLTSYSIDPNQEENAFFGLEDVLGGIAFTNEFLNDSLPHEIKYKIRLKGIPRSGKKKLSFAPPPRWNTEITYPVFQIPGPRERNKNEGGDPGYYEEGFLAIQYAVDKAIAYFLQDENEIDSFASVLMQRMPYPPYIDDTYLVALQAWLPLILLLSFLYPAVNIVKNVVYEKENRLKESMKIMGLDNWLHWWAWFAKSLLFLLATAGLVTLLLCTRWNGKGSLAVLDNSDPSLVFFFLLLYSCAAITFCFFMSTLFSKANSGATAVGIIWMFSYLPNIYLRPRFLSLSTELKICISLYFNTAMSLGCFLASMFEGTGAGLQWNLIFSGVSPDSPFCMAHVLSTMVLDTLFYAILTWYIEGVFPGDYGVPQPWNFPFKKEYWFGHEVSTMLNGESCPKIDHSDIFYEAEPTGLIPGIKVKGLTKNYSKDKVAVNNMFLNMYSNQITVLLGHNGAGKTTTMSMLTGLFPPTKGTAEVNGYDVVKNIDQVRRSIGICPQHDVLFDDLTVTEHIKFFAQLKGMENEHIPEEVGHILSGIKLLEKANAKAKTLSGGMKRKLSVGIALCGNSRVVILDEPTTGMDPGARRVVWDLLQKERTGRTMLLTTHFMEEADLLGDRIAIMADGVVQCCGSSMFLKKIYGAGYHLVMVKEPDCDVNHVTGVIRKHIPEAEVELNVAAELSYVLPNEDASEFEALFRELEAKRAELKVSSYGASQTTMEEVFLKVGENSNREVKEFIQRGHPRAEADGPANDDHQLPVIEFLSPPAAATPAPVPIRGEDSRLLSYEDDNAPDNQSFPLQERKPCVNLLAKESGESKRLIQRNTGARLYWQQFRAMLVKKALYTLRNWNITLVQVLIPIGFLIIAMVTLRNLPGVNDFPPELVLTPKAYDGTITPVQDSANSSMSSSYTNLYVEQLFGEDVVTFRPRTENFSTYLLQKSKEDLPSFNLHWMTGVKLSKEIERGVEKLRILTFFNNQPYHTPPMSLNLVDQALVRKALDKDDLFKGLSISTSNHPLPRTDTEKLTQEYRQNIGFNIGFNLAFGMSFLSASFVLFVIKERSGNCKHLQFVSGVNFMIYWLATALWDFLCFLVTCLLVLLSLYLYNEEGLSEGHQLAKIFLVLVLYTWAVLPFMYISSFFFSIPSTGFTRMSMIHTFIGMATLITVTILRIPDLELMHVANILDWLFLIFPPYAMASAIGDLYSNVRFTNICSRDVLQLLCSLGTFENPCCFETDSCGKFGCVYWTLDVLRWQKLGIGRMLTFMAVEGLLFYIIIAMIELNVHRSFIYIFNSVLQKLVCKMRTIDIENSSSEEEDNAVKLERLRIQNSQLEDLFRTDKLVFRDLTKSYTEGLTAVNHLNLGVPLGECFGLLGINGAGKTTTFKMLTGQLPVSSGDAYVNGFSVKTNIKKVQQEIGYCPQFDALLDQMTGRETLRMFARLRGVPEHKINECITSIANELLVTQHLDKQVGKYSGGNKRKISTGIALIGEPPLVLLDEPTSGMDPVARRHLWEVLNSIRDSGRSIILTSHSMEECEALCTRLAIMTNGNFVCLGSPQQLKSKFAEGYSIILRVSVGERDEGEEYREMPLEMERVHEFVISTFDESYLREKQVGRLEYFIPVEAASWADVFGILERNKEDLKIEDYIVTQTTLERVFLNFTRNQKPEKNE